MNPHGHLLTSVTAHLPQAGNLERQDGGITAVVREEHLPLATLGSHGRCAATPTATERVDAGWKSTRVRPRRVNGCHTCDGAALQHSALNHTWHPVSQWSTSGGQRVVDSRPPVSGTKRSASGQPAVGQWQPVASQWCHNGARTAGRCSFSSDTRTQTVTSPSPSDSCSNNPGHGPRVQC